MDGFWGVSVNSVSTNLESFMDGETVDSKTLSSTSDEENAKVVFIDIYSHSHKTVMNVKPDDLSDPEL